MNQRQNVKAESKCKLCLWGWPAGRWFKVEIVSCTAFNPVETSCSRSYIRHFSAIVLSFVQDVGSKSQNLMTSVTIHFMHQFELLHQSKSSQVLIQFQVTGLTLAIVGFGLGIASFRGSHFSFAHGAIGLDIMLAGLYQPLNAAL